MAVLERWAKILTARIDEILDLEKNRREIVGYGFTVMLYNLVGLAVVLVIAYFLEIMPSTVALMATLLLLRPAAGGAHCGSSFNCSIFGYLFMPLLGTGAAWLTGTVIQNQLVLAGAAFLVALGGIIKNAPYITVEKPRAAARRGRLKARALVLTILIFTASLALLIRGHACWGLGLATGLLFQGLMLLPPGIYCVRVFDLFISTIVTKVGR